MLKVPAVGLPGDGCGAEVAEFKIWFEKVKHYAPVYYTVILLLGCYTIMSLDFNPNMVAIFSMVLNFVVFLTRMV